VRTIGRLHDSLTHHRTHFSGHCTPRGQFSPF
jgi:hypothetical protein